MPNQPCPIFYRVSARSSCGVEKVEKKRKIKRNDVIGKASVSSPGRGAVSQAECGGVAGRRRRAERKKLIIKTTVGACPTSLSCLSWVLRNGQRCRLRVWVCRRRRNDCRRLPASPGLRTHKYAYRAQCCRRILFGRPLSVSLAFSNNNRARSGHLNPPPRSANRSRVVIHWQLMRPERSAVRSAQCITFFFFFTHCIQLKTDVTRLIVA